MAPGMLPSPDRSLASSTSKRRSRSALGAHLERGALGGLVQDDGLIEHGLSPASKSHHRGMPRVFYAVCLLGNEGKLNAAQSTRAKGRVMPIDFKPTASAAFDERSGVSIPQPRMLPATLPDGRNGIEYHYVFCLKDERIGALGIFGSEVALEVSGQREWLYTLDLSQDAAFEALFRFKQAIGNADRDFDFIRDVACGLVNVFAGRNNNTDAQRNVVVTTVEALGRHGIGVPDVVHPLPDGTIVLANVFVPADKA